MQKEPTVKLRVVVSDSKIGRSIESSCPDPSSERNDSDEQTLLRMVNAEWSERQVFTTTPFASELDAFLATCTTLQTCPQSIARLACMTGDPTITPTQIERTINLDKNVADGVIELANCGYFGLPRPIYYLREVLIFLGYMNIRNLAFAVNAHAMFMSGPTNPTLRRKALWHHSLKVAILARKIAEHMAVMERSSVGGEEAFIAGILHDIGKLTFDIGLTERYSAAIKECAEANIPFSEIEASHFPFSHAAVGEALVQQWHLPDVFADTIAFHHKPGNAQIHPELAATVCLADELSYKLDIDGKAGISLELFDSLHPSACAVIGLQRRETKELLDACCSELIAAKPLFSLE